MASCRSVPTRWNPISRATARTISSAGISPLSDAISRAAAAISIGGSEIAYTESDFGILQIMALQGKIDGAMVLDEPESEVSS